MTENRTNVQNVGEAISVLIQVAQLAQKSGILSLEDAVIIKSSIDYLESLNQPQTEGPIGPFENVAEEVEDSQPTK
jgi:hypothetical protein